MGRTRLAMNVVFGVFAIAFDVWSVVRGEWLFAIIWALYSVLLYLCILRWLASGKALHPPNESTLQWLRGRLRAR
jgi:hypothetical protein